MSLAPCEQQPCEPEQYNIARQSIFDYIYTDKKSALDSSILHSNALTVANSM